MEVNAADTWGSKSCTGLAADIHQGVQDAQA
jgi:hypothetical protein